MFKCQVTGEQVKPGISPVSVVVERYGPKDFVTAYKEIWDEDSRKKIRTKVFISLEGQIKKELKVAPWNVDKVKAEPLPDKSSKAPLESSSDMSWMLSYKNYKKNQAT